MIVCGDSVRICSGEVSKHVRHGVLFAMNVLDLVEKLTMSPRSVNHDRSMDLTLESLDDDARISFDLKIREAQMYAMIDLPDNSINLCGYSISNINCLPKANNRTSFIIRQDPPYCTGSLLI
ncbi:hypothetical protein CASFOL_018208 [Castilleja foliolosa]|uniref:Uncharacterized protein n=1 Tax=Castilleja foliolosa TaxID=1961234 RepID=A0ABD3D653_9LAMI